ncbi:N utilization substance protein B homolog [Candidatus Sulfobium mesophilum]|uniref:Transcription antitermination protein NusB n=1 Tax=Candidatus Sulfobium mesophilum TaxID=2016548 RepID=A0A2U3QG98_9BACT|nr:N utilization substance protein B homolog [Candidatus Sulfobium mesophilum]
MNRRKAREYALQMLFQSEFAGREKVITFHEDFLPAAKEKDGMKNFVEELVTGTIRNIEEIDLVIQGAAENWDLKRMAAVDRNILRLAIYEIFYRDDIPAAVTINEALEIAKKYSSLESVPFINGLLDKVARDRGKA